MQIYFWYEKKKKKISVIFRERRKKRQRQWYATHTYYSNWHRDRGALLLFLPSLCLCCCGKSWPLFLRLRLIMNQLWANSIFLKKDFKLSVSMYSRSKKERKRKETPLFISIQMIVEKWNWYQSSWISVYFFLML